MNGYFLKILLLLSVVSLLEGCFFFGGSSNSKEDERQDKSLVDVFFDNAQAFATNEIKASVLLEQFDKLKNDPKALSAITAKEVRTDGTLKNYTILHLLARGEASAPVLDIFKALLNFLGNDAKAALDKKAQALNAFMILRQSSIRPASEDKTQNLALARLIMTYDESLINDTSFDIADRNYLLRSDPAKLVALFKALDITNEQAWDKAAASDLSAVKDILKPLMQERAAKKSFYKNLLLNKAVGQAVDHSDDRMVAFVAEWADYGFNISDWLLDDFSYMQGPAGRFLTVYAYTLGNIRDSVPSLQKKFVEVVDALRTQLGASDFDIYARLAQVLGTLHDRSKSPGFNAHPANVVDNANDAARVLGLKGKEAEGSLLALLAKNAVTAGANNAKHEAYENFSKRALAVESSHKAAYSDLISVDRYGAPGKTISEILNEALFEYPGYPEKLLNNKKNVDAALVLKASGTNKVEDGVVKWLYEAALSNGKVKFRKEFSELLGAKAEKHREEFRRLFGILDEKGQSMIKNLIRRNGYSHQELIDEYEQFGLTVAHLRKNDWESAKDPQKKSTMLNVVAEQEKGQRFETFVKKVSDKLFKKGRSKKWLAYQNEKFGGKTAAEHAGLYSKGNKGQVSDHTPSPKPHVLPIKPEHPAVVVPPSGSPKVSAANSPQNTGRVAAAKTIFQRKPPAPGLDPLQQFNAAARAQEVKVIPKNIVANTKQDLEQLKALAQKSWDELVAKNPDKELETFVRKPIAVPPVIIPLEPYPTKISSEFSPKEKEIDDKGILLKKLFSGVLSQSAFGQSLHNALHELKQMGKDEWEFLASQWYFWSEILSNVPHILNELKPEQIVWLSTAVANPAREIAQEAQGTLHLLIAYLDIEKEHVTERIVALLPAAQFCGAAFEDRLLEKLSALKNKARNDEASWHSYDTHVQAVQALARARAQKSQAKLQNDQAEAKALVAGLLSMNNPLESEFETHLQTFLPSEKDHPVGDALSLLARSFEQCSELLFALSDHQLQQIFVRLLDRRHEMTLHQADLLINLLRGVKPDRSLFVPLLEHTLKALAVFNNYPNEKDDLTKLERLFGLLQGPLHASLNRLGQKNVQAFNRETQIKLLEQFNFLKTRLAQWKMHAKDSKNQQLLDVLKEREPKQLVLSGTYGLEGTREHSLLDKNWFHSDKAQYWIKRSANALVLSSKVTELEDAKAFLAHFCAQAPFLPKQEQNDAVNTFRALLLSHSATTPILDFMFALNHEHEVAVLAQLFPDELLVDLIKELHVADNVPLSTFKHAQKLAVFFFNYLSERQNLLLVKEAKMWELLGSQSAALGFVLPPVILAALTDELVRKNPHANEQNLARAIAKMEFEDANAAEKAYEKLYAIAQAAHMQRLSEIEKEIRSKTSSLLNLIQDGPRRVEQLKKLL